MGRATMVNARGAPPQGALYFTPGWLVAVGSGELWRYTDATGAEKLWTAPANYFITALAYCANTRKVYICCTDDGQSPRQNHVYQLSLGSTTPEYLYGGYQYAEDVYQYPTAALATASNLYISHVGSDGYQVYLSRLSLETNSLSHLLAIDDYDDLGDSDWWGGLGNIGDTIYWSTGQLLYAGSDEDEFILISSALKKSGGLLSCPSLNSVYYGEIAGSYPPDSSQFRTPSYVGAGGAGSWATGAWYRRVTALALNGSDPSAANKLYRVVGPASLLATPTYLQRWDGSTWQTLQTFTNYRVFADYAGVLAACWAG